MKKREKKNKEKTRKKINVAELSELLATFIGLPILCLYCYLCFIPVIHNFNAANVAGKIFMVIGSIAFLGLFVLLVWGLERVNKNDTKNKLFRRLVDGFIAVVYIISILHYFNDKLWGANNIIWGIVIAIFFLFGSYSFVEGHFGKKLNSEFKPIILISFAILALWIALINYDSNVEATLLYVKIAIAFVYLVAVALYVYYLLYNKKSKGIRISTIISAVFWAALILITFPFYVKWWGSQGDNFDTFVSVYASVIGGGLTLAGVAWTIQYTNKTRQEDRKNEIKPFFGLLNNLNVEVVDANEHVYHFSTHIKDSKRKAIVGNFVNSDKNCFNLKKITVAEKEYTPDSQYLVSKEEIFQIRIFEDDIPNDDCKIVLVVEDQNGNEWLYNLIKNGAYIISMKAHQEKTNE